MEAIQLLWERIENWMHTHAPQSWQDLSPGASEANIQQAEIELGIILPEDFKASARIHNGGYRLDAVSNMKILSLQEGISDWQVLQGLKESGIWDNIIPYYFTEKVKALGGGWQTGPIQPVWWHSHWIPFGRDLAGNNCCLDLIPAPGGDIGQVIDWDHETGPSRVLASSFLELLIKFAGDLEAGKYVETEYGLYLRSKIR